MNITPTYYEQERNIEITDREIIYDKPDLKMVIIHKSDGQRGLVIFIGTAHLKRWFYWYPSESHLEQFPFIYNIYMKLNRNNIKDYNRLDRVNEKAEFNNLLMKPDKTKEERLRLDGSKHAQTKLPESEE